jgi:acetylornithine deacetylase
MPDSLTTDSARREFVEEYLRFDSVTGEEDPVQEWLRKRLDDLGFETYEWLGDPEQLAAHPSFPDDPTEIDTEGRPSVGGVLEFGDPDAGPTLVFNGHSDVVPVEPESWSSDPFEPTWNDERTELTARGAADMKSAVSACVFAALALRERYPEAVEREGEHPEINGRVVVEAVVDEEAGGIGAAASALSNPYPFERDAAVVAEPTELRPITATEGTVMKRLRVYGRSAHAATRWRGESVLPHFRAIHDAFEELERERAERVSHPLYEQFDNPWPVNAGVVHAGSWASSVPAELEAEFRIGVAPGETVTEVEAEFEERLAEVVTDSEWLAAHPPDFERFTVQFEPAEIDADERIVRDLQAAMDANGLTETEPTGATYGADSRHYVAAGIPTVLFGPGTIDQAHFPDETIRWAEVETATDVFVATAERFLG